MEQVTDTVRDTKATYGYPAASNSYDMGFRDYNPNRTTMPNASTQHSVMTPGEVHGVYLNGQMAVSKDRFSDCPEMTRRPSRSWVALSGQGGPFT